MSEFKTFEERKAEKHIVSCSFVSDETPIKMTYCKFHSLNREDSTSIFSLTQLDDSKGFDVRMNEVTVVPTSFICIEKAPSWLKFLIHKFCKVI
jgi:hypothetical protein